MIIYNKQSEYLRIYEEEYAASLLETYSKELPVKSLARKIAIKAQAIDLINMIKFPQVLTRSMETSLGLYLNDYYNVIDAIKEDHDVKFVQLKKAIHVYKLEEEDTLVKSLKNFRQAMLGKFKIILTNEKSAKALTKTQHGDIDKALQCFKPFKDRLNS